MYMKRKILRLAWKMFADESTSFATASVFSNMTTGSNFELNVIKEGSCRIELPFGSKVFFNPVQEFNRDLSVSVLQLFAKEYQEKDPSKKLRIFEALSASGLRSIRYAKEVPFVAQVIANDISKAAVNLIDKNIKENGVENIVTSSHADAIQVMFNNRHPSQRFQVVDLDPYGSPSQFLDTAVQCVEDGGLLMVTCTDMAILCGNAPESCYVKYGSVPLKNNARHEMALRIALNCIQAQAARYKRYIVPILSVSVDFYIRMFVRIFTSAAKCKENTSKLAMVYSCCNCDATHLQPLGVLKQRNESQIIYGLATSPTINKECSNCGGKHHIGGPIWSAPIHDAEFFNKLIGVVMENSLPSKERMVGLLSVIKEELQDVPLYYDLPKLCSNVKASVIPMMTFRSAILNGGYRISYSHACKTSFKTDAPLTFIWDVIRKWVSDNLTSEKCESIPYAHKILSKPIEHEIDFTLRDDANPTSRKYKLPRFPPNPAPFWGPGAKSCNIRDWAEKSLKNQDKKKRKALQQSSQDSAPKKVATEKQEVETEQLEVQTEQQKVETEEEKAETEQQKVKTEQEGNIAS